MVTYFGIVEGRLLINSGKGVTEFTVREVANIAYFMITDKFPEPKSEDDPTIEEQIEVFEEKIGQRVASDKKALEAMRERMILMGLDPDAKPEISPELQAKMDEDASVMQTDEQLMFGGAAWEGREIRGKPVRAKDDDFG